MSTLNIQGEIVTLPVEIGRRKGLYAKMEEGEVFIGRPSRWGNPFKIGVDGTREEVCAKYFVWLMNQPNLIAQLPNLKGKRLMCYCVPELCHGHMIGLAILKVEGKTEHLPKMYI